MYKKDTRAAKASPLTPIQPRPFSLPTAPQHFPISQPTPKHQREGEDRKGQEEHQRTVSTTTATTSTADTTIPVPNGTQQGSPPFPSHHCFAQSVTHHFEPTKCIHQSPFSHNHFLAHPKLPIGTNPCSNSSQRIV